MEATGLGMLPETNGKARLNWLFNQLDSGVNSEDGIATNAFRLLNLYHHERDERARFAFAQTVNSAIAVFDVYRTDDGGILNRVRNCQILGALLVIVRGEVQLSAGGRTMIYYWHRWTALLDYDTPEGNLAGLVRQIITKFEIGPDS